MAFLSKLLSLIAVPILNWIYEKISEAIASAKRASEDRKRISEANKAIKMKLLSATTKEEKDAAIRDLISRL